MSDTPPDSDPDAAPKEAESSSPDGSSDGSPDGSPDGSEDAAEDAPAEFTQDPDRMVAAKADRAPAGKPAAESPAAEAKADLDDLKRQLYELNDQNSQISDLARRLKAEMANMRRRMDLDKASLRTRLVEQICGGFLPVLDDLQRAAAEAERTADDAPEPKPGESGPAPAADEALRTGVRLVARRFEESLAKQGFVEIEALGRPFDPRHHEAVHRLPATEGQEDGEVVEVYRRGYFLGDRVVRPATVVVAYHPDPATAPPAPPEPEPAGTDPEAETEPGGEKEPSSG